MNSISGAVPPFGMSNDDKTGTGKAKSADTTPSGSDPIKWIIVRKTMGRIQADMFATLLQSCDIPARAWAESAGQAFGLTVGLLGTGFVAVPEEYAEEADAILTEAENAPFDPDDMDWDTEEEP